jgi:hypothetical protein
MGIHVNTLMQEPWVKSIAGSTTAWAKLNQQQQQTIMLTYMNQKVISTFGGKVMDDVATRMNQFTASLSDVKTNLEQAFQPILYAVLPILTTFVNYLNTALQYVTAFFQALFGYAGFVMPVTNALEGQTSAVNGLAGAYNNLSKAQGSHAKAHKATGGVSMPKVGSGNHALKGNGAGTVGGGKKLGSGFVASFDQVHTIPEKSASSGGSGGSGAGASGVGGAGGAGAMPDIGGGMEQGANKGNSALAGLSQNVKGFVDKVKNFLAPIESFFKEIWGTVSSYFKGVVDQLGKWWSQWGGQITQALVNAWNFMKPIIEFLAKFIWDSIKGAIDGIIKFCEGLIEFLSSVFTGNWKGIFQGLWDMIIGGLQAVWNIFNIIFLADGISLIKDFATNALKAIFDFFVNSGKNAYDFVQNLGTWFVQAFNWIRNVLNDLKLFFFQVWDGVLHAGVDMWNGMIDGARSAWGWIKNIFSEAVGWFGNSIVTPIINAFNNIVNGFSTGGVTGGLKAVWNVIADYINNAIGGINGILGSLPGGLNIGFRAPHMFAKGGIVTGATNAIVGEAGTEVIQPLSALQSMVASTVAQTIATVMSMQKGQGNPSGGDVVLQIDGRQFARIIKPFSDMENKRIGTNVRLQTL